MSQQSTPLKIHRNWDIVKKQVTQNPHQCTRPTLSVKRGTSKKGVWRFLALFRYQSQLGLARHAPFAAAVHGDQENVADVDACP